jgi:hypothetical protein
LGERLFSGLGDASVTGDACVMSKLFDEDVLFAVDETDVTGDDNTAGDVAV